MVRQINNVVVGPAVWLRPLAQLKPLSLALTQGPDELSDDDRLQVILRPRQRLADHVDTAACPKDDCGKGNGRLARRLLCHCEQHRNQRRPISVATPLPRRG